ncbi:peptidase dimerization domain-containing protein [Alteribacillus sp. JSM 102045]|uniref:peptidase dimerization domain-containing protein n=1 Tax=Alteribacillus sp. JSM 102045 TaxID=1562101 RepID=UPI0035C06355
MLKLPFASETDPPTYNNPSINLAKLEGGTVYNKVPESCNMAIDIRYLPKQSADEILQQIREAADAKIDVHIIINPVKTKADNPYRSIGCFRKAKDTVRASKHLWSARIIRRLVFYQTP